MSVVFRSHGAKTSITSREKAGEFGRVMEVHMCYAVVLNRP